MSIRPVALVTLALTLATAIFTPATQSAAQSESRTVSRCVYGAAVCPEPPGGLASSKQRMCVAQGALERVKRRPSCHEYMSRMHLFDKERREMASNL